MEPIRLKISQAAQLLNVAPLTIRRGIYAGRIPCIRTETGRVFVPMSWVDQQSGKVHPNKEILISSITSFCEKNYGQEEGKRKSKKIVEILI